VGRAMTNFREFTARRPRATVASAAFLLVVGAFGAVFVGFEVAERKLPTYGFWKGVDQAIGAVVPDRKVWRAAQLEATMVPTLLVNLRTEVKTVEFEPPGPTDMMANSGGGMASFGEDLLLLPFDGRIRAMRPGEEMRSTEIAAPETNRRAFEALSEDPAYATYGIHSDYIRYNDLVAFEDGEKRGLLASFTEYHPEEVCFTNTVARLDFAAFVTKIDEVKAAPNDWAVIYRSKPCLKLKTRFSAVEAHMAGGRMALLDSSTVVLTMGDFHMDGMVSDGLGIAQDPQLEYGKVIQIGVHTGISKTLSLGHRNPQGIVVDAQGDIYIAEHGPQGGDEINLIIEGRNYGWPKESLGTTYSGDRLPESTTFGRHETFEPPVFAWVPSIAVSGMIQVKDGFDDTWTGDLLVGSLANMALHRIRFAAGRPVYSERIPIGSRVRAIHQHTNGQIVLWTDNRELIWLKPEKTTGALASLQRYISDADFGDGLGRRLEAAVTRCAECHSFVVGANERSPSLGRIFGDPIASSSYQNYSDGLARRSGLWTRENLKKFLMDPQSFAESSTMGYGIPDDPELVDAIIDFLAAYDERM
jgi:cytochrome c2